MCPAVSRWTSAGRQHSAWLTALQALTKNGTVLGQYPIRVLPSKTAIVPVNNQYLPRTMEERELCSRTVYAANIDKKVDKWAVQDFFETLCGERWRLLSGCSSLCQVRNEQAQGRDPGNAGQNLTIRVLLCSCTAYAADVKTTCSGHAELT